jgi:predicted branched-subunit amino acid permease
MTTTEKPVAAQDELPPDPDDPRFRRTTRPVRHAISDALIISTGMMPFGLVVGAAAAQQIVGPGAVGVTAFLYAGTAEMAGFAQLAAGSAPLAAIATIVIVNARLLLYGATLEHRFHGQPLWFRLLGPMLLIDQTYASATEKGPTQASAFRRYWFALGVTLGLCWTGSVAAGMTLGPQLPTDLPLTAAGTACLLGLLVPRLTDRRSLIAALTAAAVAVAAITLPAGIGILLATTSGILAGAIATRKERS